MKTTNKNPIIIHDPITNNLYLGVQLGTTHALIKNPETCQIYAIQIDQCRTYPATVTKSYYVAMNNNDDIVVIESDQDDESGIVTWLSGDLNMQDAYATANLMKIRINFVSSSTDYTDRQDIAEQLAEGKNTKEIINELQETAEDHAYDRSVRY